MSVGKLYSQALQFEWMEDMVPKLSSKCRRILEGLKELCLKSIVVPTFDTSDWIPGSAYFLCMLKRMGSLGTKLLKTFDVYELENNW